jgi:tRNA (guanine37-N1)-methyltransferase
MGKAVERNLINFEVIDFRSFAKDKHRTCDDAPYGGGAGMVLKPEPLGAALEAVKSKAARVIFPSPSGTLFGIETAKEYAVEQHLVFICGRYEGLDQRIIDLHVDDEVSIGDYILSSGELAALVIIDAVYRHIEGVISAASLREESFERNGLEYPHYTRPSDYKGLSVPEVLLSGNHEEIRKWRKKKQLEKTLKNRRDLMGQIELDEEARNMINELRRGGSEDGFG